LWNPVFCDSYLATSPTSKIRVTIMTLFSAFATSKVLQMRYEIAKTWRETTFPTSATFEIFKTVRVSPNFYLSTSEFGALSSPLCRVQFLKISTKNLNKWLSSNQSNVKNDTPLGLAPFFNNDFFYNFSMKGLCFWFSAAQIV